VSVADSAAGDAVYRGAGRCVGCHGVAGEGVPGLGSSLGETRLGDGSLASIARIVGGGAPLTSQYRIAMPAYGGQLTTEDIGRVAAYVYSIAHPGSTTMDAPTVPADGAVNADVSPLAAPPTTARPIRPTVPPPPATATTPVPTPAPTRRP
jgi:mono/diheme cytochrome c family protein